MTVNGAVGNVGVEMTDVLGATPSVLFDEGAEVELERCAPSYFSDLHLDQLVERLVKDKNGEVLRPLYWTRLFEEAAIRYRQAVFLDLEDKEVRQGVEAFVKALTSYGARVASAEKVYHRRFREGWELETLGLYIDAVAELGRALSRPGIRSKALSSLGSYVEHYCDSPEYKEFVREYGEVRDALRSVEYLVNVRGATVSVSLHRELPDYSKAVLATFDRFREVDGRDYRVRLTDLDMNHVLGQVLDRVAQLAPAPFEHLRRFLAAHRDVVDGVIGRAHLELPFFLSYLEFMSTLHSVHVEFCLPEVQLDTPRVHATEAVDVVLAGSMVANGAAPVPNDFELTRPERVLVITGPNQGGKTTLARTFGQLHHLGSIGAPVSATSATLALPDQISTHFERREEVGTLRGKLKDELVGIHELLGTASTRSIVIMNESFSSTSLDDSRELGHRILDRLARIGVLGVYVTFIDELASIGPSTVSMVAQVAPEDPAKRTFKVKREPANGLVYAVQLASAYGLNYSALVERLRES